MSKLKGVLKGLQSFKDSVKDLPPSDFKYKSSKSKKTSKSSDDDFSFKKFMDDTFKKIDKDPAFRERIKAQFKKGRRGLFTEEALKEYQSGKGALFKRLNPTPEEVASALGKKKPVKHRKGGIVKAKKTITKKKKASVNKSSATKWEQKWG